MFQNTRWVGGGSENRGAIGEHSQPKEPKFLNQLCMFIPYIVCLCDDLFAKKYNLVKLQLRVKETFLTNTSGLVLQSEEQKNKNKFNICSTC